MTLFMILYFRPAVPGILMLLVDLVPEREHLGTLSGTEFTLVFDLFLE